MSPPSPRPATPQAPKKSDKKQRLAKALQKNLLRRKAVGGKGGKPS